MIVTPGDLSPEGLAAFKYRGSFYLAIANEVRAVGATTATRHSTASTQRRTEAGRDGWPPTSFGLRSDRFAVRFHSGTDLNDLRTPFAAAAADPSPVSATATIAIRRRIRQHGAPAIGPPAATVEMSVGVPKLRALMKRAKGASERDRHGDQTACAPVLPIH